MIALVRGLIVIFHEMGHALCGLAQYSGHFRVFIGSYGDTTSGWKFGTKRLTIHFIYNPLDWDKGLCVPELAESSYKKELLFILAGPLGSLFLSSLLLGLVLLTTNEILKVYIAIASLFAALDFVNNIIPKQQPIILFNGNITHNDGYLLIHVFKNRKVHGISEKLVKLYSEKDFENALTLYKKLDPEKVNPIILRIVAHMHLIRKNYEGSLEIMNLIETRDKLNNNDYCNKGLAYSFLNKHEQALNYYNKTLELDPDHFYALNNRGFTYNVIKDYEKALDDFNKAAQISPEFADPYANRGLSKIKLGLEDEGLADIEKALQLDASNPYAYRNKGIYYLGKKQYTQAYNLFMQAKELDMDTHQLEELISDVRHLSKDGLKI